MEILNNLDNKEKEPIYGIYLYCLFLPTSSEDMEERKGIHEEENLYILKEREIGALVSKVPLVKFRKDILMKRFEDLEWIEEKVRIHEGLIEAVMNKSVVLPMRFCTIISDEERIRKFISTNYNILLRTMTFLKNKAEWGIKGFSNKNKIKASIYQKDIEIKDMLAEIQTKSIGDAYLGKKKIESIIEDKVIKREDDLIALAFEIIKKISVDIVSNPPIAKTSTKEGEDLVMNIACLAEKANLDKFFNEIERWNNNYENEGLRLIVTGPWPPYNFVPQVQ